MFGTVGLVGLAAQGCSADIAPGEYRVYRVAQESAALSDGCYWSYQGADANVRNDTNTMRASATYILYAGAAETFQVDLGDVTLDGVRDGADDRGDYYEFKGRSVDVEWSGPDATGDRRTTTIEHEVEMFIDGQLASGEVKVTTSWACEGATCGEIPPSCTETINFVGTEVEDVELKHEIAPGMGSGNGSSGSGTGSSGTGSGMPVDDDGGTGSSSSASGGGAGGGTCYSCADYFAAEGSLSATELCPASQALFENLSNCSCSCEACSDDLCYGDFPTSTCGSCVSEVCAAEVQACLNDTTTGS